MVKNNGNVVAKKMMEKYLDYDMLYGHRRDIDGYAKAVAYFDERLPEIINKMRDDDVLMITADHGCDPGYLKTTDHTREYVPFIMYGKNIEPKNLGTRYTFADMGATVLDGAVIGEGSIVAAHALVLGRTVIGPNELWGGVPAKFIKKISPAAVERTIDAGVRSYVDWAAVYNAEK